MLDHISLQCSDLEASAAFYSSVLPTVGMHLLVDNNEVLGYGEGKPSFWIGTHRYGEGFRESHIAFTAARRSNVDAFYAAAVALGGETLYAPKIWPQYHPDYYAAFVRDPDGNNIEAVCQQAE
ncbi:catechol 2,3-dioxygenase-like lactoylglutathione lyase family enzyme [Jatrophihabitans sp. GAS493]|uniref:VOC family protein n=1 Tax=Jatrophihabitans sp. GAS493 TaxID=1907575 RepID=UPI000BB73897|nr:VOC family protein [Jatrophihabitans sp. GAS493]SOD71474.1 catechol 2,3-dioxygenase-like lactoylglutathione lyase family enzyme [Jatrophihabitans sp. GAS493]